MRTRITLAMILLVMLTAVAQPPDTLWSRTYGSDGDDHAQAVQQTADGGYVMVGYWQSGAQFHARLIKTDSDGDSLWSREFGGTDLYYEAWSVQQTADGGFVLAGNYEYGSWIAKTDINGNEEWSRSDSGYTCNAMEQTNDGGFALAGSAPVSDQEHDMWLMKTDSGGDSLWSRTYGESGTFSNAKAVCQTSDGGFVLVGSKLYTEPFQQVVWLAKMDSDGFVEWSREFQDSTHLETASAVCQTPDGDYVIAGYKYFPPYSRAWLLKTDENGNEEWNRDFGGDIYSSIRAVEISSDGSYALAGAVGTTNENPDMWLLKADVNGDSLWSLTLSGDIGAFAYAVRQTSDGGYVLAGVKVSLENGCDWWLVKTGPEMQAADNAAQTFPWQYQLLPVYPNPFNAEAMVSFEVPRLSIVNALVYDVTGRKVTTLTNGVFQAGEHRIIWNGESYSSGVYFVTLQAGEFIATQKAILLK